MLRLLPFSVPCLYPLFFYSFDLVIAGLNPKAAYPIRPVRPPLSPVILRPRQPLWLPNGVRVVIGLTPGLQWTDVPMDH